VRSERPSMKYKLNYIPDSQPVMYELYENRIMGKAADFICIAVSGKGRKDLGKRMFGVTQTQKEMKRQASKSANTTTSCKV